MLIDKEQLQKLYVDQDMSHDEIARKLQTTSANVMYHIGKYGLRKVAIKKAVSAITFAKPESLTQEQALLHNIAMLFFASNNQSTHRTILLEHTRSILLKVFIRVVTEVYKVDLEHINAKLRLYTTDNPKMVRDEWAEKIGLPKESFLAPEIINPDPALIHSSVDAEYKCTVEIKDRIFLEYLEQQADQYLQQIKDVIE